MEAAVLVMIFLSKCWHFVLTWTPDTCWSPSEDAKLHTAGSVTEGAAHPLSALPEREKSSD